MSSENNKFPFVSMKNMKKIKDKILSLIPEPDDVTIIKDENGNLSAKIDADTFPKAINQSVEYGRFVMDTNVINVSGETVLPFDKLVEGNVEIDVATNSFILKKGKNYKLYCELMLFDANKTYPNDIIVFSFYNLTKQEFMSSCATVVPQQFNKAIRNNTNLSMFYMPEEDTKIQIRTIEDSVGILFSKTKSEFYKNGAYYSYATIEEIAQPVIIGEQIFDSSVYTTKDINYNKTRIEDEEVSLVTDQTNIKDIAGVNVRDNTIYRNGEYLFFNYTGDYNPLTDSSQYTNWGWHSSKNSKSVTINVSFESPIYFNTYRTTYQSYKNYVQGGSDDFEKDMVKRAPTKITIYGSNNNVNFTKIMWYENIVWQFRDIKDFELQNPGTYRFYRFVFEGDGYYYQPDKCTYLTGGKSMLINDHHIKKSIVSKQLGNELIEKDDGLFTSSRVILTNAGGAGWISETISDNITATPSGTNFTNIGINYTVKDIKQYDVIEFEMYTELTDGSSSTSVERTQIKLSDIVLTNSETPYSKPNDLIIIEYQMFQFTFSISGWFIDSTTFRLYACVTNMTAQTRNIKFKINGLKFIGAMAEEKCYNETEIYCTNVEENYTIYVDNSIGSDINENGTREYPFKTIQKAIDSIPKNLNGHNVKINIVSETYDEYIKIVGYHSGKIYIESDGNVTVSGLQISLGSIVFINCPFQVVYNTNTPSDLPMVYISEQSYVQIQFSFLIDGKSMDTIIGGIMVQSSGALCSINDTFTVKNINKNYCICCGPCSCCTFNEITGDGNKATGILSNWGGNIVYNTLTLITTENQFDSANIIYKLS